MKKLISGPNVFICNECIDISIEIIENDSSNQAVWEHPGPLVDTERGLQVNRWCSLCQMLLPATGFLEIPEKGQICGDRMTVIRKATGDVEREPAQ